MTVYQNSDNENANEEDEDAPGPSQPKPSCSSDKPGEGNFSYILQHNTRKQNMTNNVTNVETLEVEKRDYQSEKSPLRRDSNEDSKDFSSDLSLEENLPETRIHTNTKHFLDEEPSNLPPLNLWCEGQQRKQESDEMDQYEEAIRRQGPLPEPPHERTVQLFDDLVEEQSQNVFDPSHHIHIHPNPGIARGCLNCIRQG